MEHQRQHEQVADKLKLASDRLDNLRIERSELQQRHAKEIGAIDNVINQEWAKLSSLIALNLDLR